MREEEIESEKESERKINRKGEEIKSETEREEEDIGKLRKRKSPFWVFALDTR